jgi:hypothetical protein
MTDMNSKSQIALLSLIGAVCLGLTLFILNSIFRKGDDFVSGLIIVLEVVLLIVPLTLAKSCKTVALGRRVLVATILVYVAVGIVSARYYILKNSDQTSEKVLFNN